MDGRTAAGQRDEKMNTLSSVVDLWWPYDSRSKSVLSKDVYPHKVLYHCNHNESEEVLWWWNSKCSARSTFLSTTQAVTPPHPAFKMPRQRPNILISGTPGTGKSLTVERLLERTDMRHISVNDLAKENDYFDSRDEERDAMVLDEEAILDEMEPQMQACQECGRFAMENCLSRDLAV